MYIYNKVDNDIINTDHFIRIYVETYKILGYRSSGESLIATCSSNAQALKVLDRIGFYMQTGGFLLRLEKEDLYEQEKA